MQINTPLLMAGLLAALVYAILLFFASQKGVKNQVLFSSNTALQNDGSGVMPLLASFSPWLRVLAILCIVIAISQPRKGEEAVQVYKQGIAISMLLDRSASMGAPMEYRGEVSTRFQVVKSVFRDFLLGNGSTLSGRPSDRIGLTTFASFAEEESPLTLDHQTLNHIVQSLQTADAFGKETMIGGGLYYSSLRFIAVEELFQNNQQAVKLKSKIIILLTDGQQTPGGFDPLEAASFAAANGIKVYCIAIVSPESNSLFGFFNQELNTETIEKIAEITGGSFYKAKDGKQLAQVYEEINNLETTDFEEHFTSYEEYYIYFVAFGIFFLTLEFLLQRILLPRFAS